MGFVINVILTLLWQTVARSKKHQVIGKKIFVVTTLFFLTSVLSLPSNITQKGAQKPTLVSSGASIAGIAPAVLTNVSPRATITPIAIAPVKVAAKITSESTLKSIGKPAHLLIPSIKVDAYVEHLGLTPAGAVDVPPGAKNVAWFNQSPLPGQIGSSVIVGHTGRWKNGTDSVFNRLHTVKPGDSIYVKDDNGTTRLFTVKELRVYGKDETVPEIFNKTDAARLNIITCHGDWLASEQTYSKRLVVFAQLQ